jgi:DNA invertase Pin-like site-specific DNA recombinase
MADQASIRQIVAGIYGRVSTGEQSVEMQLLELIRFCEARGWQIRKYLDSGISGAKERRPQLDALWADARRRALDVVVVYRFDRFARNTRHLVNALHEFDSLGIQFVSLHENVDTTTPNGRLVFTIFAAIAEFERELIRDRISSALEMRKTALKQQGYFISKKGYRRTALGRPRVYANASKIVALRATGTSWAEVCSALNISKGVAQRAFYSLSEVAGGLEAQ